MIRGLVIALIFISLGEAFDYNNDYDYAEVPELTAADFGGMIMSFLICCGCCACCGFAIFYCFKQQSRSSPNNRGQVLSPPPPVPQAQYGNQGKAQAPPYPTNQPYPTSGTGYPTQPSNAVPYPTGYYPPPAQSPYPGYGYGAPQGSVPGAPMTGAYPGLSGAPPAHAGGPTGVMQPPSYSESQHFQSAAVPQTENVQTTAGVTSPPREEQSAPVSGPQVPLPVYNSDA